MKYGGSFATGFAQSISNLPSMVLQLKQRRKAEDEVKAAKEEFKLNSQKYTSAFDTAYKDGTITPVERSSMVALTMVLGAEFSEQWKEFDKTYLKMEDEQRKSGLEEINAALKMYTDFDPADPSAILETIQTIQDNTKSDSVRTRARIAMDSIRQQGAKQEETEKYATLKEFQDTYGETAAYEYDKEGYIRPKYVAPKDPKAMSDYQRKRQNIMSNKSITEDQRKAGIYKLDTGIDITPNDDEGDFTTTEGKRTADFAFTQLFGYTTPDGIKIAGIVPANLARVLSLGRKATDAEVEEIKFDWEARKNVVRKMGGSMAVDAIDTILNQLFRETKPEDVISDSLQDKAIKYIEKVFGGTNVPDKTKELPKVEYGSKTAMVPLMSKEEVKAAMESTDINDPLYKELYDRAVKEGWITE